MTSDHDFITTVSQLAGNQDGPSLPDPFPFIPNPPEGFDPEADPLHTSGHTTEPPEWAKKKQKQQFIPYARVFMINSEGNPEYDNILRRGANGEIILAKKEVADLKGSPGFKVYLEWMEPVS